jgi:hypothetical protein
VRQRIAEVFGLDRVETAYLEALCNPKHDNVALAGELPREARQVLDELSAVPAFALNQRWDVIAWNETARRIADGAFERADEFGDNLLWAFFMKTHERIVGGREEVAQRLAGAFRLTFVRYAGDETFGRLVRELESASAEFSVAWKQQVVSGSFDGPFEYEHPELGALGFYALSARLTSAPGVTLCIAMPDGPTHTILRATR